MIAEDMKNAIATMRGVLARDNGDFLELAPLFLDGLEAEAERVEALESAVICEDASVMDAGCPAGGAHV